MRLYFKFAILLIKRFFKRYKAAASFLIVLGYLLNYWDVLLFLAELLSNFLKALITLITVTYVIVYYVLGCLLFYINIYILTSFESLYIFVQ